MQVLNQHKRIINKPKPEISKRVEKLASKDDTIWPNNTWSPMKFKNGLKVGSKGGHGIIRYTIIAYDPEQGIRFQFTSPKGFDGTHEFDLLELPENRTEVSHVITMKTRGIATLKWVLFIRWLHDALIEDALDNLENNFSEDKKTTTWSPWVKLWRWLFIITNKTRVKETRPQNG